ncbi:hypothetical protein K0U91_12270 [Chryseobacterium chendengshani]|uniref:hypothetical protein n=1 Tax=Chryseobacterium sp. LJ668 TaxID=2864040 RepID=UPI001C68F208|nr:hypothetical protein [Chryseobacterium sp. LJ668]MBW8523545.1 hypothetical protein [Chryseobacterium sp. LJ668]QYK15828.1 hypothetical protein K0U91_12270 [Chryseobacterium sp. LJ668]
MSSFLLLFFVLFSCQQSEKKVQEKKENETVITEKFSKPDFKINQLELREENSLTDFYSQNIRLLDNLRYSPVTIFTDKEKKEYLIAYQYEGDVKNSFSCFELGYLKDDPKLERDFGKTKYDNFKTESGLKLGMTSEEITNLKGTDFKVEKKSKEEIIRYTIDNPDDPKIKQYEMPPYFMEFYLKDNRLYKIIFGFEYP